MFLLSMKNMCRPVCCLAASGSVAVTDIGRARIVAAPVSQKRPHPAHCAEMWRMVPYFWIFWDKEGANAMIRRQISPIVDLLILVTRYTM
jgi:hypothetical protein